MDKVCEVPMAREKRMEKILIAAQLAYKGVSTKCITVGRLTHKCHQPTRGHWWEARDPSVH